MAIQIYSSDMYTNNIYRFSCDLEEGNTTASFDGELEAACKENPSLDYIKKNFLDKYPKLSSAELLDLCRKKDYNAIALHHSKYLFNKVKKDFSLYSPSFCDAFQDGMIALMKKAETFDPKRSKSFITYVELETKGSVCESLRKYTSKQNSEHWKDANKIGNMRERFFMENGYDPDCMSLAIYMQSHGLLTKKSVESLAKYIDEILVLSQSTESMDSPTDPSDEDGGNRDCMGDNLTDHSQADDELCRKDSFDRLVDDIRKVLSERDTDILLATNGIGRSYDASLNEMADKYDIDVNSVRNVTKKAPEKIKKARVKYR